MKSEYERWQDDLAGKRSRFALPEWWPLGVAVLVIVALCALTL